MDDAPRPLVSVGIVTWNSASHVEACLTSVRAQTLAPIELLVVDNGSTDGTDRRLRDLALSSERILLGRNTGFSAAHNLAIARTSAPFYLALNPDVTLSRAFLETLVEAAASDGGIGSASPRLTRAAGTGLIDSAGIYLLPSQRHLDRGQDEPDRGQFRRREYVFGVTGAAGLYRRAMLEDVAIGGEVFDEDYFAYREDVDLAWRAQWRGWRCLYVPEAEAFHVRRVTPERRALLPPEVNRASVRNRFLLRIKNQPLAHALRFAAPALWRDLQVIGYTLVREQSSLPAFADLVRLLPRMVRKRRQIMGRRVVSNADMARWFRETSRPVDRN